MRIAVTALKRGIQLPKVSVYIIAYNEAAKIRAAIESVQWADEIVLADSHSTDETVEIATSLGARIVQIPFRGFGDLRNRAMAECRHEWIFSLDADERCTPETREEIHSVLHSDAPMDAYYVPRKNFFMGRRIRYSGFYPDYRQPQLFRAGVLEFKLDPVHESFVVHSERIGFLKNAICQFPYKSLDELLRKANRYSALGAEKLYMNGDRRSGMSRAFFHGLWAFIHLYILKAGFLDGWPGFLIAFSNLEGTFYKYAKLHERLRGDRSPSGDDQVL
jgi:glycosyltransferase involved in cell wall biosynthesis